MNTSLQQGIGGSGEMEEDRGVGVEGHISSVCEREREKARLQDSHYCLH